MKFVLTLIFFLGFGVAVQAQSKNPKAQKCFDQAYNEYVIGNQSKALKMLACAVKKDPSYSDAYSLQAAIYEGQGDSVHALEAYRNTLKADPLRQVNYYHFAQYLFKIERYTDALQMLDRFEKVPEMPGFKPNRDAARDKTAQAATVLKESCSLAIEDSKNMAGLNIQNLGPNINTSDFEYWPGMTIDGNVFIFTKMLNMQEDFYISTKTDSGWSTAIPLPGRINTPENEGTTSISADGRYIFFTVCNQEDCMGSCDLFYSAYNPKTGVWSRRMNLGKSINSPAWDAQPAISADGRTLIFSSSRPGGYGRKDLWMSRFSNGKWSDPENLGPTVNTPDDDEAPFLHYDGKTLYFSSDGHPGYGQHDLFVTRKNADGSWSKPVNMGKGINTSDDETGLYVERKGDKAYFVSSRKGGFGGLDIYSFDLGAGKKPDPVSFVTGFIFDEKTKAELYGRIEIVNLNSNAVIYTDSAPNFFTTLEPGGNYALNVYRSGYLFYSDNFQPTQASIDSPFVVNAYLKAVEKDKKIVLENIFFDVDKFELKPESKAELEAVIHLLKSNPSMKVEISGHTDNTGSEDHNIELSKNRAASVQSYLVANGIAVPRVTTKGYGASQPVADNETDSGRAKNRRIEMKVISL